MPIAIIAQAEPVFPSQEFSVSGPSSNLFVRRQSTRSQSDANQPPTPTATPSSVTRVTVASLVESPVPAVLAVSTSREQSNQHFNTTPNDIPVALVINPPVATVLDIPIAMVLAPTFPVASVEISIETKQLEEESESDKQSEAESKGEGKWLEESFEKEGYEK
jgi:hypothetical protein